jgi:hypothetical protein
MSWYPSSWFFYDKFLNMWTEGTDAFGTVPYVVIVCSISEFAKKESIISQKPIWKSCLDNRYCMRKEQRSNACSGKAISFPTLYVRVAFAHQ